MAGGGREAPLVSFGRLRSASAAFASVVARLEEAAATDLTILIEGETGTGKELAAEAIHAASRRRAGPYLVVDCAAIPAGLIESELFGHARGAFTSAELARAGAFEAAAGGTVFIDEVGELPLPLQSRLLGVLERRQVRRVGDNELRAVDVRILAATNRRLEDEVAEGRFRADLFHRLAMVRVELPPLRERPEDVALLSARFLGELGRDDLELTPDVRQRLLQHDWPGNVRELRNVIERAASLSDRALRLPAGFGRSERRPTVEPPAPPPPAPGSVTAPLWLGKPFSEAKAAVLADFERGYVEHLIEAHHGNVSRAAEAAGIHRNILHRLMRRHGIGRTG